MCSVAGSPGHQFGAMTACASCLIDVRDVLEIDVLEQSDLLIMGRPVSPATGCGDMNFCCMQHQVYDMPVLMHLMIQNQPVEWDCFAVCVHACALAPGLLAQWSGLRHVLNHANEPFLYIGMLFGQFVGPGSIHIHASTASTNVATECSAPCPAAAHHHPPSPFPLCTLLGGTFWLSCNALRPQRHLHILGRHLVACIMETPPWIGWLSTLTQG